MQCRTFSEDCILQRLTAATVEVESQRYPMQRCAILLCFCCTPLTEITPERPADTADLYQRNITSLAVERLFADWQQIIPPQIVSLRFLPFLVSWINSQLSGNGFDRIQIRHKRSRNAAFCHAGLCSHWPLMDLHEVALVLLVGNCQQEKADAKLWRQTCRTAFCQKVSCIH